jgi:hypothetical protein
MMRFRINYLGAVARIPWSEHNKIKICTGLLGPQHCNTTGLQHRKTAALIEHGGRVKG